MSVEEIPVVVERTLLLLWLVVVVAVVVVIVWLRVVVLRLSWCWWGCCWCEPVVGECFAEVAGWSGGFAVVPGRIFPVLSVVVIEAVVLCVVWQCWRRHVYSGPCWFESSLACSIFDLPDFSVVTDVPVFSKNFSCWVFCFYFKRPICCFVPIAVRPVVVVPVDLF